jgi:hypothetical protein
VRRSILLTISLSMAAAVPLSAGTFDKARIAPDLGLDSFTRGVTRQQLSRDLFSDPYATVTVGSIDVYDRFPYVETRTFQVVSDPRWNRLITGEMGKSLSAYDGAGTTFGTLAAPHGLAVDESDRVYVADTDNDRVLVLQASTEFDVMQLTPVGEIRGLSRPYGVAVSDAGTPFVPDDDVLYVADTGRNRIVAFALQQGGARQVAEIGALGGGRGRFAGPLAVAVGHDGGANTRDVYVADAHSRRIVHLRDLGSSFQWVAEAQQDADVVTSLDTDQWGNVYAAAPRQGVVHKLNADLSPVADLRGVASPRGFHVPFFTLRDHRVNRVERIGKPDGVAIDQWSDVSGVTLWNLGVEVANLAVETGDAPAARFAITDRADVTLELADRANGRVIARRAAGTLDAGEHRVSLSSGDLAAAATAAAPVLRVSAASSYPDGAVAVAEAGLGGSASGAPNRAMLLGNSPNPVKPFTRILFALPDGSGARLRIFDASGRTVRVFDHGFTAGLNQVTWDGTDTRGAPVGAGVYFYRLDVGALSFSRKMVVVR